MAGRIRLAVIVSAKKVTVKQLFIQLTDTIVPSNSQDEAAGKIGGLVKLLGG
jgi:hypothetical protein